MNCNRTDDALETISRSIIKNGNSLCTLIKHYNDLMYALSHLINRISPCDSVDFYITMGYITKFDVYRTLSEPVLVGISLCGDNERKVTAFCINLKTQILNRVNRKLEQERNAQMW